MFSHVVEHIKWIFSGVGVLVVSLIVTWIYRKRIRHKNSIAQSVAQDKGIRIPTDEDVRKYDPKVRAIERHVAHSEKRSRRPWPTRRQWKNWTLPSKLTAIGAYISILALILSVAFFIARYIKPPPTDIPGSLPFTIGYFNASAIWLATAGIHIFCIEEDDANYSLFIEQLNSKKEEWDTQPFLYEIQKLSAKSKWPSGRFLSKLRSLVGRESLRDHLLRITSDSLDSIERDKNLVALQEQIDECTGQLLLEAKNAGLPDADLGMVFVGNQIGKIEQLIVIGRRAGEQEKILPSCRNFLRALFMAPSNFNLTESLYPVLSEFPRLGSRVDSLELVELTIIVTGFKRHFMYNL